MDILLLLFAMDSAVSLVYGNSMQKKTVIICFINQNNSYRG